MGDHGRRPWSSPQFLDGPPKPTAGHLLRHHLQGDHRLTCPHRQKMVLQALFLRLTANGDSFSFGQIGLQGRSALEPMEPHKSYWLGSGTTQ
jgi:hypothetical protein